MSDYPMENRTRTLARFRQAVAEDLELISLLHDHELTPETLRALRGSQEGDLLALSLRNGEGKAAIAEIRQGLADLPAGLTSQTMDILAAEYADIYLNHGFGASPCESVWLDEDHLAMQEPMFQVRAWYARFGVAVEDWRKRSDDHLVNQLRFMAHLLRRDEGDQVLDELSRFLDEHLLRWIPDFARRVGERARTRFYGGLARLTAAYLQELREVLVAATGRPIPDPAEIEEAMRPKKATPVAPPAPYIPGAEPSW